MRLGGGPVIRNLVAKELDVFLQRALQISAKLIQFSLILSCDDASTKLLNPILYLPGHGREFRT